MKPAVLLLAMLLAAAPLCAAELDAATGLAVAGDWQLVRDRCTACHSARLITQQRGSERQWRDIVELMQTARGLPRLAPEEQRRIVAYLGQHYPPSGEWRRAPLPPALLPPNPYPLQQ